MLEYVLAYLLVSVVCLLLLVAYLWHWINKQRRVNHSEAADTNTGNALLNCPKSSFSMMYSATMANGQGSEFNENITKYLSQKARQMDREEKIMSHNKPSVKKRVHEL
ncbi:hypothetical protein DPMN_035764 [Dreissena polymorpha]|uniref:Uncharacterized protein n=1 Tax=Dreissena polymorpha TaxID=45954 RepID=A0A9D4MCG2_DREPO|nr:hypothetical protein DPMN_035764 [Dreissena polymorpha]